MRSSASGTRVSGVCTHFYTKPINNKAPKQFWGLNQGCRPPMWRFHATVCIVSLWAGDFHSLVGFMPMVLHFSFVLDDLTLDLVREEINGCQHGLGRCLAVDVFAGQPQSDLGDVIDLFFRKDHLGINNTIKMTRYLADLAINITANCRGYLYTAASNTDVHRVVSCVRE